MKIASIFLITYSSVHYIKTLHFPYHIFKCPPFQKHYTFLMKIASIFLITYSSVHYIKTLHFPYQNCAHISYHIFKCPLYQHTTLSLSKLRPYFLSHIQVSTISKYYTFLIKIASIFLITYSSVHYIKALHFPYQNCVHISYHIFKCPLYQNTTLSLSKLRPYLLVSTISKHYTFLIKIASIFASVHYIKTLHFPYQNCVHISYHIFKCPLYQNTTLSLSKLRPYFLSHIQVSTISTHYTFLIKIAPIFLITYSSVHYINTLHFPYQNCAHISYHIFKCPLYQHTTLSLSKLRPYFLSHMQVSTISQHYTFPIQTCQNCVHRQMSTIPNGFIFPTLPSTISFTTLFLCSITTVGLVSCFEQLS